MGKQYISVGRCLRQVSQRTDHQKFRYRRRERQRKTREKDWKKQKQMDKGDKGG